MAETPTQGTGTIDALSSCPSHRPPEHEGLQIRPGSPLVPRLRRLRGPGRRPGLHARTRPGQRKHRVHLRHRMLLPLPVLHEHLRHALHPRPRTRHRHRPGHLPPRPVRLGRHRRRDALSIGGNHLIHALRRNVNLKILLFNNRIYGLTKGQYSPTSETGKITKSTPMGSLDAPFNPLSLALGAEATFVARTIDSDRKHLTDVLRQAAAHPGTALVEIYQNCNIFNDGAFSTPSKTNTPPTKPSSASNTANPSASDPTTPTRPARPPHRRPQNRHRHPDNEADILIHDAPPPPPPPPSPSPPRRPQHPPPHPIGVLRSIHRPVYDTQMADQLDTAIEHNGKGDLTTSSTATTPGPSSARTPGDQGDIGRLTRPGPSVPDLSYARRASSTSDIRSCVHSDRARTCSAASLPDR